VLHAEIERLIQDAIGRSCGPEYSRRMRCSGGAPQIRAGGDIVRWPYLAAPTTPIDERNIAVIAGRAFNEDVHTNGNRF
jgi:hypothetical protein